MAGTVLDASHTVLNPYFIRESILSTTGKQINSVRFAKSLLPKSLKNQGQDGFSLCKNATVVDWFRRRKSLFLPM
jgi:hypothetical protein